MRMASTPPLPPSTRTELPRAQKQQTRERRILWVARLLAFAGILAAAVLVPLRVQYHARDRVEEQTLRLWEITSLTWTSAVQQSLQTTLQTLDSVALALAAQHVASQRNVVLTGVAGSTNNVGTNPTAPIPSSSVAPFAEWATLSSWVWRGSSWRVLTNGGLAVLWSPLVNAATRATWEQFATSNRFTLVGTNEEEQAELQRQDELLEVSSNEPLQRGSTRQRRISTTTTTAEQQLSQQNLRRLQMLSSNSSSLFTNDTASSNTEEETSSSSSSSTFAFSSVITTANRQVEPTATTNGGQQPQQSVTWLPLWQASPSVTQNPTNLNLLDLFLTNDALEAAVASQQATLGPLLTVETGDTTTTDIRVVRWLQQLQESGQFRATRPQSSQLVLTALAYPVVSQPASPSIPNQQVVGALTLLLDWLEVLRGATRAWNVLLNNSNSDGGDTPVSTASLVVVLTFATSEVAWRVPLGTGDVELFSTSWRDAVATDLDRVWSTTDLFPTDLWTNPAVRSYTLRPLSTSKAREYELSVYPHLDWYDLPDLQDASWNNEGGWSTTTSDVTIVLGVAVLLFLVYDRGVHLHLQRMDDRTLIFHPTNNTTDPSMRLSVDPRSRSLTTDPGAAGDENLRAATNHSHNSSKDWFLAHNNPLAPPSIGGGDNDNIMANINPTDQEQAPQAAVDGFATQVTILVADLTGFDEWSASHPPDQVLEVLHTIFRAFAHMALPQHVVEVVQEWTLPDNGSNKNGMPGKTNPSYYMAVAGLTEATLGRHAVVMTEFARDCWYQFERLGPPIGLRIGIHTGMVMAGYEHCRFPWVDVLSPRAENTIKVATRMVESCPPGCIQVSTFTAKELYQHGKPDWLIPRDEGVFLEGQGETQTYFVKVPIDPHSAEAEGMLASMWRRNLSHLMVEDDETERSLNTAIAQLEISRAEEVPIETFSEVTSAHTSIYSEDEEDEDDEDDYDEEDEEEEELEEEEEEFEEEVEEEVFEEEVTAYDAEEDEAGDDDYEAEDDHDTFNRELSNIKTKLTARNGRFASL